MKSQTEGKQGAAAGIEQNRYSFAAADFQDVIAHGGSRIRFSRVVNRASSPGCIFIDLSIVRPAGTIGLHTHGLCDEEIYVIVEGEALMFANGETFAVGPGDVIVNPPGGTHGLRNTGSAPVRLVVIDVGASAEPRRTGGRREGDGAVEG